MHDLVIRGGTIVDGTGAAAFEGDIALEGGRISAVGEVSGAGREEIQARGCWVTPGFVDIHTHYDGQVTWDPHLTPSSWHGVTTVVFGNCGVGFAPVRPGREDFLIGLMEGVEDIPGSALSEGIRWDWETFPEFLHSVERLPKALDVGAQVPHGAIRAYAMGERGARNEPATESDIAAMAELTREGIEAGALGFSTSRTIVHRAVDGEPVPGTFAAEDEIFGIGRALGRLGRGVFELAPVGAAGEDVIAPRKELDWMCRLSAEIGRPVSFALLQVDAAPDLWRELLDASREASAQGAQVYPQVAGRPFGMLIGHQTDIHPFAAKPSYRKLASLPLAERVAELRRPEVRAAILAEPLQDAEPIAQLIFASFHKMFPMGDPPDYEPEASQSIAARAEREGREPADVLYDAMLEKDGRALLLFPLLNYSELSCDPIYEMLHHPQAVLGLGDGGAHCGIICDASIPTFMLSHWVRDRSRGPRLPIELAVCRMTRDTARLYGLHDRGQLRPGFKGDLNVIDPDRVALELPEMVHDLPSGARRLIQRARGYRATVVSGEVIVREGELSDARPGRLIRGAQPAPAASWRRGA
ncbi:MAG: amidohydrolase family protein, partial [Myxococcota bacterium]